jgi:hypothetical protein
MSQQSAQGNGGFQPTWKFAKEFLCEATLVAVVITRTNHMVPQYSIRTGRYKTLEVEGQKLLPFVGCRVTHDDIFSGVAETENIDSLLDLIAQAKEWIQEDLAEACEKAQARVEAREQREANRNHPEADKPAKKRERSSTEDFSETTL